MNTDVVCTKRRRVRTWGLTTSIRRVGRIERKGSCYWRKLASSVAWRLAPILPGYSTANQRLGGLLPLDYRRSYSLSLAACNSGHLLGCTLLEALSLWLGDDKKSKAWVKVLNDACHGYGWRDMPDSTACTILGDHFRSLDIGAQAQKFYERACKTGQCVSFAGCAHARACHNAAVLLRRLPPQKNSREKTLKLLEKGCTLRFADSCRLLGNIQLRSNTIKALDSYSKACELEVGDGCFNVAVGHHSGQIGEKNLTKALRYYRRACKMGLPMGVNMRTSYRPRIRQKLRCAGGKRKRVPHEYRDNGQQPVGVGPQSDSDQFSCLI